MKIKDRFRQLTSTMILCLLLIVTVTYKLLIINIYLIMHNNRMQTHIDT